MAGAEDWGAVPVNQTPGPVSWGAVPEEIKMPDLSGVRKMAQENLAQNAMEQGEEKQAQSPSERLDTAVGTPVKHLLNPNDNMPLPAPLRQQYTKQLQEGGATNFGDFMQTALHAISPLAAGVVSDTPERRIAKAALEGVGEGYAGSEMIPTDPTDNIRTMLATAVNIPFQGMGAAYGAFQGAAIQAGREVGSPALGRDIALAPEAIMAAGEFVPHLPAEPWINHPGSEPIKQLIAKDKPASSVPSSQVDKAIAEGVNHKAPTGQDFKAVAAVTGIPETALHNVFNETGVKPDQVFEDAQRNPEIAQDVSANKVPLQYEHLVEPKTLPPRKAEFLQVSRDEETRSFSVVDKDGDHVQGGFDSYDEAKHYIEDKKFEALEKEIESAKTGKPAEPTTEKTEAGEQQVIPGAERISDRALAERKMDEPLKGGAAPLEGGLFDVAGRAQGDIFDGAITQAEPKPEPPAVEVAAKKEKPTNVIPPSEIGKPTSLRTFLSNNGAKFNEANEVLSIKRNGERITGAEALEHAEEIAKEHGYLPKDQPDRPSQATLHNVLAEKNGGREAWRDQDTDRLLKMRENAEMRKWQDPSFVEHEAHNAGIDTERLKDETDKQFTQRLINALKELYSEQGGGGVTYRKMLGDAITAAEKFAGKLTGGLFKEFADGYTKLFQPELAGDKALRFDAYLAKYKASIQEAKNAYARMSEAERKAWDKKTPDERMEFLYDHETGRWNEEENPDHARYQASYDAMHEAEEKAIGGQTAYKDNYLPHQWEKEDEVRAFFNSPAMIKKYGADWFKKASEFKLVQEGVRAGFKLKTDNPESMLVARQLASHNMLATMDLLHGLENDGLAKRATAFSIDKKIARTTQALSDLQEKYKALFDKINDPRQMLMEGIDPLTSKAMRDVGDRQTVLKERLDAMNKEKAENKLTPEQMAALKLGFRIIGPDSKVWHIHPDGLPIWRNAMELKGLWDRQGASGNMYRYYMGGKAIYVRTKMLASLFHPSHVAVIDISSDMATAANHLIQGGKISDLMDRKYAPTLGYVDRTFTNPVIEAWNTAPEARTAEQKAHVKALLEGGLIPTMPEYEAVNFKENFDRAINGIGKNNLRLLGTAIELPGQVMAPVMKNWIPSMKVDAYMHQRELAMKRDPTLANDAGRRGEVSRKIAQDIERNYGEMNRNTLFWNPVVKDAFNAAMFSGGWKLAMLQNMRGLAEPGKIAYNWAKTGEFSKEQVTHQMLQSYIYTGNMLMLGAGLTYLFTGAVGTIKDWINPPTGEKNPDGSPVRLRQPAFFNEPLMLLKDINEDGVVAGTGSFFYHQTLIPGIADSLLGRDFVGRPYITDPTNLHQWMNMGLDSISPITFSNTDKASEAGAGTAKIMGWFGFPMAGNWVNQTPFEQKIVAAYYNAHPSTGSALQAKLAAEMKGAIVNKDAKNQADIEQQMRDQGMTSQQISNTKKMHSTPFAEHAWKMLTAQDQKRLIEHASEEEKKKFKVKGE